MDLLFKERWILKDSELEVNPVTNEDLHSSDQPSAGRSLPLRPWSGQPK